MRKVTHLVIHCTATPLNAKPEAIQSYWKNQLKWKTPGYHKLIQADGLVIDLLPDDKIANGVQGHNKHSLHVSWIGGMHSDDRTMAQRKAIAAVLLNWLRKYPQAKILGHCDLPGVKKACPRFDASSYEYLRNYLGSDLKDVPDPVDSTVPSPTFGL
jgi:N-acetylmuramoyl-L-alanine amidase